MEDTNKTSKNTQQYYCELCDFLCSKKGDWFRHINRLKHINNQERIQMDTIKTPKTPTHNKYVCECGNNYIYHSGLYKHKKKCINNHQKCEPTFSDLNSHEKQQELIEYLLKENSEFKQMMLEQNKSMIEIAKNTNNITPNIINNNTVNSNNTNNKFNLNVYLNETCKDAMNIMEFVNQLQVGIKDLEETGRLGYAEGISKIFINGLNQINISDRPIHCSDSKREIVYIKDKNQWTKDDNNKSLLTNAIKYVAHKNMKQISEWTKCNKEYSDSSSKQNDRYQKIVSNSMNGLTVEETNKNYNKIIKNIVRETVIEK